MTNHYETLGVEKNASHFDIRKAYRRKAREHHADKNAGDDDGKMADINVAYEILGDETKRKKYDEEQASYLSDFARGMVIAKIGEWMQNEQLENTDAMSYVREALTKDLVTVQTNKLNGERIKARVLRHKRRFKFHGNGEDVLGKLIDSQLQNVEAQLEKIERDFQKIELAFEISKEYTCESVFGFTTPQRIHLNGITFVGR